MTTTALDRATLDALAALRAKVFAAARKNVTIPNDSVTALGWAVTFRVSSDNPAMERTCVLNATAKDGTAGADAFRPILDALGAPREDASPTTFQKTPTISRWEGRAPGGLVTAIFTWKVDADAKVGRNDPCPCGSGRKWKKCCAP